MGEVSVRSVVAAKQEELRLEVLCGEDRMDTTLRQPEVNRLGLCLAGYVGPFLETTTQVYGQTEHNYLGMLSDEARIEAIRKVFAFRIPLLVITRSLDPPPPLLPLAAERGIPVVRSSLPTNEFVRRFTGYLEYRLSPRLTVHGTLVDVYGVGLLYMGEAAIGKSECALDLVERGHRLIADDVVTLFRRGRAIIGQANELTGFFMEIRGLGLINVQALFGIRAVGMHKRVEVVVRLEEWTKEKPVLDYERLGMEYEYEHILGVDVPRVTIPIFPGKNITVISEVVAMSHILRVHGCNPALEFEKRMVELLSQKRSAEAHFLDYEE